MYEIKFSWMLYWKIRYLHYLINMEKGRVMFTLLTIIHYPLMRFIFRLINVIRKLFSKDFSLYFSSFDFDQWLGAEVIFLAVTSPAVSVSVTSEHRLLQHKLLDAITASVLSIIWLEGPAAQLSKVHRLKPFQRGYIIHIWDLTARAGWEG